MLHAGGGLTQGKEGTGFHGAKREIQVMLFINRQSNLLQNRAGRFEPVVKLL